MDDDRLQLSTNLIVAGFALMDNLPVFTSEAWTDHVAAWHTAEGSVTEERWKQAAIAASIETHYGANAIEKFAYEVGVYPQRVYEYRAAYKLAVQVRELDWSIGVLQKVLDERSRPAMQALADAFLFAAIT